ncbi:TPR domain protein [Mariniradius saccharolyticus AK6]|uniref:TPR domain protein n=1 Tax=Mariniradius saccharolyticus AK6 TaxID=1239962 RepID=M7XTX4_9BACT|nr:tetratricopeptide repeat protein [Mariniradius saccharolyticus]EMS31932.1 TPR domain protein [Mariniradius saccharolyticus AK6]
MKVSHWVFAALIGIMSLVSCSENLSNKGDQLYSEGKFQEAVIEYDNVLKNKPKYVKALYNRGRAYEEMGDFSKAEKDFLAAYAQDNKNTQVLLSLSNIYQKQKNHNSALLYADAATQIPGAPAMAFFMKGRALHQIGSTEDAMKEYSLAIQIDKDFGQAYYYRGMLKIATDRKRSGCEDIRAAIKLDYADAKPALEKYCK